MNSHELFDFMVEVVDRLNYKYSDSYLSDYNNHDLSKKEMFRLSHLRQFMSITKQLEDIRYNYQDNMKVTLVEIIKFYAKPMLENYLKFVVLSDEDYKEEYFHKIQLANISSALNLVYSDVIDTLEYLDIPLRKDKYDEDHLITKLSKHLRKLDIAPSTKTNPKFQASRNKFTVSRVIEDIRYFNLGYTRKNVPINCIMLDSKSLNVFYSLANMLGHSDLRQQGFIGYSEQLFRFYLQIIISMLCSVEYILD